MKQLITLSFLFFSVTLVGQSWAVPGANWKYNYSSGFGAEGYVEINYEKDTVIAEQSCQKLVKYYHVYDHLLDKYWHSFIGNEYTYDDSGVVYLWYENNWDTLYNFNAEVGESWEMAKRPLLGTCDSNSRLLVVGNGIKSINNIDLKFVIVEFDYGDNQTYIPIDTIIEKIGLVGSYMFPYDFCNGTLDAIEGGPLRCYFDNELGEYKSPTFQYDCDQILTIKKSDLILKKISLSPNPASDWIQLNGELDFHQATVKIQNLVGQKQLVKQVNNKIDISHLPNGMYILNVIYKNKEQNLRFIKQ